MFSVPTIFVVCASGSRCSASTRCGQAQAGSQKKTQVYATKVSRLGGLLVRAGELGMEVERYRTHIIQSRAYVASIFTFSFCQWTRNVAFAEITPHRAPFTAQHESFKFNIIGTRWSPGLCLTLGTGHSMGGLDARYYVAALGGSKHVASITTIGTPHHGSHIADLAIKFSEMARVLPSWITRK